MKSLNRYITEALNMTDVNIIVGRFQPFTEGHKKCADYVYDKTGVPTVLCVIDTKKVDDKHPFLTKDIEGMFDDIVKNDPNIIGWVRVKNADIVANTEILKANNFIPVSWACGTDRFQSYDRMARNYSQMAGLSEDFKAIEIKRGDDDISATRVREALLSDDRKEYEASMPKYLYGYYEVLKELISQK